MSGYVDRLDGRGSPHVHQLEPDSLSYSNDGSSFLDLYPRHRSGSCSEGILDHPSCSPAFASQTSHANAVLLPAYIVNSTSMVATNDPRFEPNGPAEAPQVLNDAQAPSCNHPPRTNGSQSSDSELEYETDEKQSVEITIPRIRMALLKRIIKYEEYVRQCAAESVGRGLIWERKALLPDDNDLERLRKQNKYDAIVATYKESFKTVGKLIHMLKQRFKVPMATGTTCINSEQAALSQVHARRAPAYSNSGQAVTSAVRLRIPWAQNWRPMLPNDM